MNRQPITETFRVTRGPLRTTAADGNNGAFLIPFEGAELRVVCSDGLGWDHVSVSQLDRDPKWREMCYVRSLFFDPEEWVVQFHPARSAYRNCHEHCLHLYRSQEHEFPTPPPDTVAPARLSRPPTIQ